MAIEFPCAQCGTLLRVPDEAAGKHAKCAKCGAIMLTPPASVTPASPPQPLSPQLPSSNPSSPNPGSPDLPSTAPGPGNPPPFGQTGGENPSIHGSPPANPIAGPPAGQPPSGSSLGNADGQAGANVGSPGGRNPFDLLKPGGMSPGTGSAANSDSSPGVGAPSPSPYSSGGSAAGTPWGGHPDPYATDPTNPYQTPTTNPFSDAAGPPPQHHVESSRHIARGKLMPVGIAMLITGVLSLLFHGLGIIGAVDEMGRGRMQDDEVMGMVMIAIWIVWSLVVIASSIGMLRMKSLPLCWTGTVAALIPCTCCLFVSMPVGIWAAIVLADPMVSAAIRNNA